jgi:hypothetical protein
MSKDLAAPMNDKGTPLDTRANNLPPVERIFTPKPVNTDLRAPMNKQGVIPDTRVKS